MPVSLIILLRCLVLLCSRFRDFTFWIQFSFARPVLRSIYGFQNFQPLSLFTAKTLKTLLLADSPCPLVVCCILSLPLSAVDVVPVDLFACLYSNFLFSTLLLSLSSPARSKHFKNYRMYSTSTPFLFLPYFTLLSSRLPTRQTSRRLAPPLPVIRFGYRGFGYVEPTHLSHSFIIFTLFPSRS